MGNQCRPNWTSRFPDPEGRESATPFDDHTAETVVVRANAGKALRVFATVTWAAVVQACLVGAYRLHAGVPQSVIIVNDARHRSPFPQDPRLRRRQSQLPLSHW